MKPKKKHVIVKAFLNQKETHSVKCDNGSTIELFIGRKYGENTREMNPVVCEVIEIADDVDEVVPGDLIIVHHNLLVNDASVIESNREEKSATITFMANNMIHAKIDKETGELTPLYGNCIAERIVVSEKSFILSPEQKNEELRFKIISTPKGYDDVAPGDEVICYKLSDYEMVYNFKGSEKRAIRIWKEDILAIYNN